MQAVFCVYKLTNSVTGKSYIGQTTQNIVERFQDHRARAKGAEKNRSAIHHAIARYGWETFHKSVIEICQSQEELDSAEQHWIKFFNTIAPNGYNIAAGGSGGGAMTAEIKEKIAKAKRGKPRDAKTLAALAAARLGKFGESAANVKLSWEIVRSIRHEYSNGASGVFLSRKYNVTISRVSSIVLGNSWPDPNYKPIRRNKKYKGKLTTEDIEAIRLSAEFYNKIAEQYGVSVYIVGQIKNGTYKSD